MREHLDLKCHVTVEKLTDVELMREANEFTMRHEKKSKQTLERGYFHRHSPIRTQLFIVRMYNIPSFVSTHLVRHSATGQQHYVSSNRGDLGGDDSADRYTPVHHMMILNAQHLEEMSWARLCVKSSLLTRKVWKMVRDAVAVEDRDLAERMVPECVYLGRCHQPNPCPKL